ncbi:copper resistance protein NlpE N-terminal domain-containing protein [Pseudoxanthomonas sp. PXM01]|uniref:copper resistance protein NlpE N-terminal domain-containing protein n=1 Tax=Pseudoxanthomonas sp. PXM01 TaxID=2769295 RepID=UPI00178637E2|nr:copper resistance protein NlpE N-terminal domain-containing protein [Pseudoxanthomonas sp. PXM01]MBD9468274.1 copper resistance protein NlpE N-terminal domain-containing protein [Pseudoxanthomonas sp. PXM01]
MTSRSSIVLSALLLAAALVAPGASADVVSDSGATERALAGRYFGTLPSDACASLDVLLTLHAGGHYVLQSYCQDDLASSTTRGTWTVTWNETCIDLAPVDDAQPRREFALHDDTLLVLTTGSCVEPAEDPRGRMLRRADTAGER